MIVATSIWQRDMYLIPALPFLACCYQISARSSETHRDDVRKQHLAVQLFSGVSDKPRSTVGRGHLGTNRMSRNSGKTKFTASHSEMPTVDNRLHSLQKSTSLSAGATNMDLLCDLESKEVHDYKDEHALSKKHALFSTLDMALSHDHTLEIQETAHSDACLSPPTRDMDRGNQTIEQV